MKTLHIIALTLIAVSLAMAPSALAQDARPGFYTALEFGSVAYSLDDKVEDRLGELGLNLSDEGNGGGLAVGYLFDRDFALELGFTGRDLSTGDPAIDAALVQLNVEVIAPLKPGMRVSPYVAGQLGATVIGFQGDRVQDRAFVGASMGLGGGVGVQLSDHFGLDFSYRASVVDFKEESLEVDGGTETIDLEGSGRIHSWGMRVVYSF